MGHSLRKADRSVVRCEKPHTVVRRRKPAHENPLGDVQLAERQCRAPALEIGLRAEKIGHDAVGLDVGVGRTARKRVHAGACVGGAVGVEGTVDRRDARRTIDELRQQDVVLGEVQPRGRPHAVARVERTADEDTPEAVGRAVILSEQAAQHAVAVGPRRVNPPAARRRHLAVAAEDQVGVGATRLLRQLRQRTVVAQHVVRIDEADVGAARGLDRRAPCGAYSPVVRVPQDAYPFPDGGIFGHDFAQTIDAAVGRSIVDEDELRVDVALREQRTGAVGDIALHSVDGNEHREVGHMSRVCFHILANVANFR